MVCSVWNTRVLSVLCGLGIAASLKRLWLGLCLGRKTYGKLLTTEAELKQTNALNRSHRNPSMVANHAEDLAEVVKKALMLCEVAALASELQSSGESAAQRALSVSQFGLKREEFDVILRRNIHYDDDTCSLEGKNGLDDTSYKGGLIVDPTYTDARRGVLDQSQRLKINELLGAWYVALVYHFDPASAVSKRWIFSLPFAGKNLALGWVPR